MNDIDDSIDNNIRSALRDSERIAELEAERQELVEALRVSTDELESWNLTEGDPDSGRIIRAGKRLLAKIKAAP